MSTWKVVGTISSANVDATAQELGVEIAGAPCPFVDGEKVEVTGKVTLLSEGTTLIPLASCKGSDGRIGKVSLPNSVTPGTIMTVRQTSSGRFRLEA